MKFAYFFDLDGVLTDSSEGLLMCFRSALKALHGPQPDDSELRPFLGTPLPEFFRAFKAKVTDEEIDQGIKAFRELYEAEGILMNRLYPGAKEMLIAARKSEHPVLIVTTKPTQYARRITVDLGIADLLDDVVGAGLAETDTKITLVATALASLKTSSVEGVMLGDRHYDVEGALANGLTPVGALWGYGSRQELEDAGCREFASSPADFAQRFILSDVDIRRIAKTAATKG